MASLPIATPFPNKFETLAARYEGKRKNTINDMVVSKGVQDYFTDPLYGLVDAPTSDPIAKKLIFDRSGQKLSYCGFYTYDMPSKRLVIISDSM